MTEHIKNNVLSIHSNIEFSLKVSIMYISASTTHPAFFYYRFMPLNLFRKFMRYPSIAFFHCSSQRNGGKMLPYLCIFW